MPTLEVDQIGLICIAALVVFMILLLAWLVYYLHTCLIAMHKKAGDLETQQMVDDVLEAVLPALKKKSVLAQKSTTKTPSVLIMRSRRSPNRKPKL